MTRSSAFCIATGHGLDDRFQVLLSVGLWIFSPCLNRLWGSSGFCPLGWLDFIPGLKRSGREPGHSAQSNADVKKMWVYTCTPPYVFMAQYVISQAEGHPLLLVLSVASSRSGLRPNYVTCFFICIAAPLCVLQRRNRWKEPTCRGQPFWKVIGFWQ
jgi:hypothetical protein